MSLSFSLEWNGILRRSRLKGNTFGPSPVFRGHCLPSAAFFRRRDRVCLSDFSGRAEFSKKRSGPSEYDDDEGNRRRGRNGDKNHHRRPIHPSLNKLPFLDLNQKRHKSTLLYSSSILWLPCVRSRGEAIPSFTPLFQTFPRGLAKRQGSFVGCSRRFMRTVWIR